MNTSITATDAARSLSDLLNRVRYRGESFTIVRNGEEVARLAAVEARPGATLSQMVDRLVAIRTGDPAFGDDLERIQADQPPADDGPWTD